MRILVADQNALLLAAISATFGRHCDLVTATRREACLEYAQRQPFDVVVASDKLTDYSGLELLSEIGGLSPETLLIFAASPERLKRLSKRLQVFGLFATISYPLTPPKLLAVLKTARQRLPRRTAPQVRHVVLESEWETGERLGLIERQLEDGSAESTIHEGWRTQQEGDALSGGTDRLSADSSVQEFVFSPTPSTGSRKRDPVVINVPPPPVPIADAGDAADVSAADGVLVSNDPVFDQPPEPEVPPEPQWAEDGAANDIVFDAPTKPARSGAGAGTGGGNGNAKAKSSAPGKPAAKAPAASPRPKVRKPTQPTAAQLAAFERARARRDAAMAMQPGLRTRGGGRRKSPVGGIPEIPLGTLGNEGMGSPATARPGLGAPSARSWPAASTASLADLARKASSKRPLADPRLNRGRTTANRAVFVVGSGLAAVLVVAVLTFELLRTPANASHLSRAQPAATPFASGGTFAAGADPSPTSLFSPSPPPASDAATAANLPPNLDPGGPGTPDPPSPPPSASSTPMEPPWARDGHPLPMVPPDFEPQPDTGSDSSGSGEPTAARGWN